MVVMETFRWQLDGDIECPAIWLYVISVGFVRVFLDEINMWFGGRNREILLQEYKTFSYKMNMVWKSNV